MSRGEEAECEQLFTTFVRGEGPGGWRGGGGWCALCTLERRRRWPASFLFSLFPFGRVTPPSSACALATPPPQPRRRAETPTAQVAERDWVQPCPPPPPARPTAVPGRPGLWLKHAATAGRHAAESRPPPGPSPSGRAPAGRGPPRGWCTPLCMDRGRVGGRPRVENSEGKGRAESDGRLPPPHHGVGRTAAWQGRVGGPCCTLQVQRGALHARLCGGASHSCCGASARFARLTG